MFFVNVSMSVCVVYYTWNSIYSFLELITYYDTLTELALYTKCYEDNPTDRLTYINIHVDDRVLRSVEVGIVSRHTDTIIVHIYSWHLRSPTAPVVKDGDGDDCYVVNSLNYVHIQ